MQMIIVFAIVVAAALAAPAEEVTLNKFESEVLTDGYNFSFETSDGTARDETAILKNAGTENEAISVTGSIRWIAPSGEVFVLKYVADENGFQPEGEHLPKA